MNTRERFLALMNGRPVDRTLKWEMGYWAGTVRRWYQEGLPQKKGVPADLSDGRSLIGEAMPQDPATMQPLDHPRRELDVHDYFELDDPIWRLPLNILFCPPFEKEILEDHGDWILHRNEYGVIVRDRKDFSSLPHWVKTPVSNRDEWERLKEERLSPEILSRLPREWPRWKEVLQERTFPLMLGGYPCGFYGTARLLLGEVDVMTMFYDDPALMHDIMDHLTELWISLYDRVLAEIEVDGCLIWEDMCFKQGPLISPVMFREFILPCYKRLTACLRSRGAKVIMIDTDGNYWKLFPLLIEGGVTAYSPNEVNAKMDVVQIRKTYPDIALLGGG